MASRTANPIAALLAVGLASVTASAGMINVPGDYATIQAAIIVSSDGDEIVVAPGVYMEAIDFLGRAITVRSLDPADPTIVAATIINGNGADRVVQFVTGEGRDSVLDGLTVTGGRGDYNEPVQTGAGVYSLNASPTVRDCVISGNYAYYSGGGMYISGGAPFLERCRFDNNQAGSGGGMFNQNATVTVLACSFTGNESFEDVGGGVFNFNCTTVYQQCHFYNNTAPNDGGAGTQGGTATFYDCEFVGNHANGCGGGLSNYYSAVVSIELCRIYNNSADTCAGAIQNYQATPTLIDSVVCSNGADQITGTYTDGGGNTIGTGCPPIEPVGACCVNGACIPLTEATCAAVSGTYAGDYTECSEANCPASCPGDTNGDGQRDVVDLLALLAGWGTCP